jgi:SMI1/KNR4 family protein SUKH-1
MALPPEYLTYFAGDGRKEGGLTVKPGWFQLWPPAEIERWNREYHVSEYAPGFLGFGSSGGGEILAFDNDGGIVMIPFIGMSADEAIPVAHSWSEFVERIER